MTITDEASRARASYDAWHAHISADEDESPWHRLLRRHLDPAQDLAGRRVLEIGCGRGSLTRWMMAQADRPATLVAADFSGTAVAKAKTASVQAGHPSVAWAISDIQAIGIRDATFDTVISCETIEHVPDPPRALRELARVLKPGGRLLLTTPNYLGPMGLYRGYLRLTGRRYTETGQPVNRFTMLPLTRAWTAGSSLDVEIVDGEGHYLPFPGRSPVRCPFFDRPRVLTRWFALHSLVVARKRRT